MAPGHLVASPSKRWILAVLVFAFVFRVAAMYFWMDRLSADPDGYRELATHMAGRGEFSLSGRVAYRPPLYPITLLFTGAYEPTKLDLAARLHVIFGLLTVWVTILAGARLGLGNWALLAGGLVAVDPILVNQSTVLMTETLAALTAVAALHALVCATIVPSFRRAAWAGLMLGMCCLCRPTFLPWALMAPLVLALFKLDAPHWRAWLKRWVVPGACALVLMAMLALWCARNYARIGAPVVGTTHGGFTLYLGNNPDFYKALRAAGNFGTVDYDATSSDRVANEIWEREYWGFFARRLPFEPSDNPAELPVDAELYQLAFQSIVADPLGFIRACLYRVQRFWGLIPNDPPAGIVILGWGVGLWYVSLFTCALAGAWRLGKYRVLWQGPWVFGLLLVLTFMAVHTVYWTDMRMRAPVTPVVCLAAAVGVFTIYDRYRGPRSPEVAA